MMIEKFMQLKQLCSEKCIDKDEYIKILGSMEIPEYKIPSKIGMMLTSLQEETDKDYKYLSEDTGNPYIRMKFGESYLYRNLWNRMKDSGLGHVSLFCVKKGYFDISMWVSCGLHKSEKESVEEFKIRQDCFFDELPYQIIEVAGQKMIADTDKNWGMMCDWFESFLDIAHIETVCRDGYIHQINIFAKDIVLYEKAEQPQKTSFGQASIENIMKECDSAIDSLRISECITCITDTAMDIVSHCYINICNEIGYENEYCKKHKDEVRQNFSNLTYKKAEDFGSTIEPAEILTTASGLFEELESQFIKDYCAWFNDIYWHDGVLCFTASFSTDAALLNGVNGPFRFDQYAIERNYEYVVDASYFKEVKEILMKNCRCFYVDMEVVTRDDKMMIKSISGKIKDILLFPLLAK